MVKTPYNIKFRFKPWLGLLYCLLWGRHVTFIVSVHTDVNMATGSPNNWGWPNKILGKPREGLLQCPIQAKKKYSFSHLNHATETRISPGHETGLYCYTRQGFSNVILSRIRLSETALWNF